MSTQITIEKHPDVWILIVVGELDYGECAAFRRHIDRIISATPPACIVDFSRVDFLDSSGLGLLLALARDYGRAGGSLGLVANETVESILEITRLNDLFHTYEDVPAALTAVRSARGAQPRASSTSRQTRAR